MADSYNGIWILNSVSIQILKNNWFTYVPGPIGPTSGYGYYIAGQNPGAPSGEWNSIDRLDYSNDTANCLDRADLQAPMQRGAALSDNSYAYSIGGTAGGIGASVSTIERYDYANDTTNATMLRFQVI